MQQDQNADTDLTKLQSRIAELEAARTISVETPEIAALPANMTNERLRQEIDLITRGLVNQTGRVSRLKAVVEGAVEPNGEPTIPARVTDEIGLAKRGLANLTRRINTLDKEFDQLADAASDITRLQQQMANVDRAFLRISGDLRKAKAERRNMEAALATLSNGSNQQNPNLAEIQSKLEDILTELKNESDS